MRNQSRKYNPNAQFTQSLSTPPKYHPTPPPPIFPTNYSTTTQPTPKTPDQSAKSFDKKISQLIQATYWATAIHFHSKKLRISTHQFHLFEWFNGNI
jgi:hypothetical protein